jgi:hypothetical protein
VSSSRTIDVAPGGRSLKIMLLGAAGFWLPDTLLHALGANRMFSWYDTRILAVVLPLTFLATFLAARRLQRGVTQQVKFAQVAFVRSLDRKRSVCAGRAMTRLARLSCVASTRFAATPLSEVPGYHDLPSPR